MMTRLRHAVPLASIAILLSVGASMAFAMTATGQRYLAPAPLRGSHAKLGLKCSTCHVAFNGVPDEGCAGCHKKVAKATALGHGRHAGMIGACVNCHALHDVPNQMDQHIDRESVDHARMRFDLKKHEQQSCDSCHGKRFQRFDSAASRRCRSCHLRTPSRQAGLFGITFAWAAGPSKASVRHLRNAGKDCLQCHRGKVKVRYKHKAGAKFFRGKHVTSKCGACHKKEVYKKLSSACASCHKQRHGGGVSTGCGRCHGVARWRPAKPRHDNKLQGVHPKLRCRQCHKERRFDGLSWKCERCHKAEHEKNSDRGCGACHDQTHWKPAHFRHSAGLRGAHTKLKCGKCHRDDKFTRLDPACVSCHANKHYNKNCSACHNSTRWRPATMNHKMVSKECGSCHRRPANHPEGACSQCHSTTRWRPASAAHGSPIGDRHGSFACSKCHAGGRYTGLSWSCSSCHSRPANHPSGACNKCHSTTHWRPAAAAHGSPIGGPHASSTCSKCHAGGGYTGLSWDCAGCHRRPANHPPGACSNCHSSSRWRPADGGHGIPIAGAHVSLACSKCHTGGRYSGLSWDCASCHGSRHYSTRCSACHSTTRWKPATMNHVVVSKDCASCHARPSGHYPGGCGGCHSTSGWRPASGAHSIPLGGDHLGLGCNSCHAGGKYTGLSWACTSCHSTPHGAGYSSSCGSCHRQTGWGDAGMNHGATTGDCSLCHKPPGQHATGTCRQCHPTGGSWDSNFSHPKIEEHSYKDFSCASCHPSGYSSRDCVTCHNAEGVD